MSSSDVVKIAVTGATGFLGKEFVIRVVQEGHPLPNHQATKNVLITAIGRKEDIGKSLEQRFPDRVKFVKLDLAHDKDLLDSTLSDQHFVYHCAALCTAWGRYPDFYDANVIATQNVVDSCTKSTQLIRLVHISTPSVYTTGHERINIKESDYIPPTAHQMNDYSRTKLIAEGIITQAHANGLPVISLRPRGIFGEGDNVILPKMIEALQKRRMVNLEPDPNKLNIITELTHVDNVVQAMLCASVSDPSTLGKFYNITNGETVHLYSLLKQIARDVLDIDLVILNNDKKHANSYEPRRIGFNKLYYVGYVMEWFYALMGWYDQNPTLTRYNVCVLGLSMSYDIENAKRDLGYVPRVSLQEGITRTLKYWKDNKITRSSL
jgi:nucleoside-diphosphate-sugar epimerase